MKNLIGIRREDKDWESRAPLTPDHIKELSGKGDIAFVVQRAKKRAFPEEEYEKAGAKICDSLLECPVILGIKEIPSEFFEKGKTYLFFSHTIKGQDYNMAMLKKMMDMECNLIDYERIVNEAGKRLLFFGNYAGLAGMVDTLWALGKRFEWEGIKTPFLKLKKCYQYKDLESVKEALREIGEEIKENGLPEEVCPLVVGFAGYGNVSKGAQEILDILPFIKLRPEELSYFKEEEDISNKHIYKVVFKVKYMAQPIDKSMKFKLWHYFKYPRLYRGIFKEFLPHLTVLMNCIYWESPFPRLITKKQIKNLYLKNMAGSLKVVGDISCDINGSIEFTEKSTKPDDPVFVYDPLTEEISSGYEGRGIVVMAVDNLPCELPREASHFFGKDLMPFISEIASADYSASLEDLALSSPIKKALILHKGKLTPEYKYIEKYLADFS